MNFSKKIVMFAAVPALLFVIGLGISITSLMHTQSEFDRYLRTERAVQNGLSDMYAQGLQMGQALRNVVLDPKNPKALENLKAAQSDYEKAFASAQSAAGDESVKASLQALPPLRAAQARAQEKTLALLQSGSDAVAVLNAEETPAWRALKAELLKQGQAAEKRSAGAQQSVNEAATLATRVSIGMALLAGLVAVLLNFLMQATVRKELGGDPADARAALSHIAQGNLAARVTNLGPEDSLMGTLIRMEASLQSMVRGVRQSASGIATASGKPPPPTSAATPPAHKPSRNHGPRHSTAATPSPEGSQSGDRLPGKAT